MGGRAEWMCHLKLFLMKRKKFLWPQAEGGGGIFKNVHCTLATFAVELFPVPVEVECRILNGNCWPADVFLINYGLLILIILYSKL